MRAEADAGGPFSDVLLSSLFAIKPLRLKSSVTPIKRNKAVQSGSLTNPNAGDRRAAVSPPRRRLRLALKTEIVVI